MRKKRRLVKKTGAPQWMVTFSDLVTLLLVFFILLFSVSQIDKTKFQYMAESFRKQEPFDENPSIVPGDYPSEQQKEEQEHSLARLFEEVQLFLKTNGLEKAAEVMHDERGVVLVLNEQLLFDSGEAALTKISYPVLKEIGLLFASVPHAIKVEGHTDNVPIRSKQYPSNWELSAARASSVIRYFIQEHSLASERFTAIGYADTRPIVSNTTEESRKKNRRVEIVITEPK